MINEEIIINLKLLLNEEDQNKLKQELQQFKTYIFELIAEADGVLSFAAAYESAKDDFKFILDAVDQVLETKTIERSHYYLKRLIKSLTEVRTGSINDINLNRWKEYDDILTDSLWILPKRDRSGEHTAGYWGNFIPQIPNQLIRRYTKSKDWVLDPFLGSGTTLIESKRLGRNGIGIELSADISAAAAEKVERETAVNDSEYRIFTGDCTSFDYSRHLKESGINSVQLAILHPPYWDIIKFSEDKADLSNSTSAEDFISKLMLAVDSIYPVLEKGRYLALVIGDKYSKGEWIPLGFMAMQQILERKYKLKSIVIKNFEETKGKMNKKELWRYRALAGGFYIFKHEYIFLFRK